MWNRNSLFQGLAMGIVIPILAFGLFLLVLDNLESIGAVRQRTLAIIAICLNIIPFNIYQKRRFTQSMRGLATATVIYAVIWVIVYGSQILNQN